MPTKKSTIYDLAALANVSASTVSAVLSDSWRERRIAEATALKIRELADKHLYSINRQASGLRKSKSGLTGMIIPQHDNRFFSGMAQAFERFARERQWHPLVVSTLRDPSLELETVRTLISYRVEYLLITGATDPDPVSKVCRQHGVAHVNVDLPGHMAASVISDNYWGAQELTRELIQRSRPRRGTLRNRAYFVGGLSTDYATQRRIEGFSDVVRALEDAFSEHQVDACGYAGDLAEAAVRKLYARIGGLPKALFINSTIALEGVARFLKTLPLEELNDCVFGCYDWDPFASMLSFPLVMVRQNVDGLMAEAFRIIDDGSYARKTVVEIKPELILP
ncbi:MAG: LacI family DNA-binding transcriptional regulator [Ramlibacter sp.]|nr:LacI family DNA-binding transcriptional regulator [Ramlibacter sp.]